MKLELGGGVKARGDGWVNMDCLPVADIRHDLNVSPWPIGDDTVGAVYSSHTIEHLDGPFTLLSEIARVARVGSAVEIRAPHPFSDMALCAGHVHVFSPTQAQDLDQHFPTMVWSGPKRLRLQRIDYHASAHLPAARKELPFLRGLSDSVVMKWIPRTCHECCFHYTVTANEHFHG